MITLKSATMKAMLAEANHDFPDCDAMISSYVRAEDNVLMLRLDLDFGDEEVIWATVPITRQQYAACNTKAAAATLLWKSFRVLTKGAYREAYGKEKQS